MVNYKNGLLYFSDSIYWKVFRHEMTVSGDMIEADTTRFLFFPAAEKKFAVTARPDGWGVRRFKNSHGRN